MPWIKCLGGGGGKARRGKPLSVSQPIHLLVKSDFEPQCHVFRTKQLRKPRPCHLCHQAVIKQASCCRVCKYICHKTCEDKFVFRFLPQMQTRRLVVNMSLLLSTTFAIKTLFLGRFMTDWSKEHTHFHVYEDPLFHPAASSAYFLVLKQTLREMR